MHYLKTCSLTLCLLFILLSYHVSAREQQEIDSLKTVLDRNTSGNEEKLRALNELFVSLEYKDPKNARMYIRKALPRAEKTRDPLLEAETYYHAGRALMRSDSCPEYLTRAIGIYRSMGDSLHLGPVYYQLAKYHTTFGQFQPALENYQMALSLFEQQDNLKLLAQVLSDMANMYTNMSNYELSYDYSCRALSIQRELQDTVGMAFALVGITEYYFYKDDTANIFSTVEEAISLFHELNYPDYESYMYSNLGDAYMDYSHDYDRALKSLYTSLELLDSIEHNFFYVNTLRKLGRAYDLMGDYDRALDYAVRAVANTDTANLATMMYNYILLTYIYISKNDSEKALESFELYRTLNDELQSDEINNRISDLEVRYETQKKEATIQLLEEEKKLSRLYLWGLALVLLFVLVGAYLVFRAVRDRMTIAEQQLRIREQEVAELEKDRQIVATNSLLEGEEAERRRIARDLHDGLGGLLSGVKFSLSHVKSNYITNDDGAREYENTVNLLDNSINELRRIAHNMMPESLIKLGLNEALADFCQQVDRKNGITVNYQFFGEASDIPQKYEIALYRIAQELINNAVRHSGGSEILVQVVNDHPRLCLIVQDNGKGFDEDKLQTVSGIGLNSVRSRINALEGELEIDSTPGKGVEITINLQIKQEAVS